MGEWTWLFQKFPVADIELMSDPIDVQAANVIVRTIRAVPGEPGQYEVRVAPHNVSPFKGGPWLHRFSEMELANPGPAIEEFRQKLYEQIQEARARIGK